LLGGMALNGANAEALKKILYDVQVYQRTNKE
jgi:hypothetical protein